MHSKFKMKDLGQLSWFLGINFTYSSESGTIEMNQSRYVEKMLSRFNMSECKPRSTPCDVNLHKLKDDDTNECTDGHNSCQNRGIFTWPWLSMSCDT